MNLYFQFFNEEKSEYIKVDNNTSSIKTNLDKFNLKVFELESEVDLRNVTNTTLMIEKENKGVYYHYKAVNAVYDSYEKSFNFKDIKLTSETNSEKFRIVLEFKENGIVVYNTKERAKELYYKPESDEFNIDVHDAKRISDVFELQNENEEQVTFTISIDADSKNTTSQYRWWFDNKKESSSSVRFEPLGDARRTFSHPKNLIDFFENEVYIHIEIKDVFGNIRSKKYKILAPGNTYSLMELFNEPIIINSLDTLIKLFIDYRNCVSIRPAIKYVVDKTERVTVSDKLFGEAYYKKNIFEFKINEVFDEEVLALAQKFILYFKINESESVSNEVEIVIDNKKPTIKLSNLDEENYMLIVDDKSKEQINGMVFDESLFFIGSESRKCTLSDVTKKLFIYSNEEIEKVEFINGEKKFLYSYGRYYICEDLSVDFTVYDKEDNVIDVSKYEYIRHLDVPGNKHFYMILDKSKLSNYERNIIDNQGGLVLKGPITEFLSKQEFVSFADFYFVSCEIPAGNTSKFPFSVGITDFDYDFSKYFYDANLSCKLTQYKELDMDFDSTKIIFLILKKETEVLLFNDRKKLKTLKTHKADEIFFCALSSRDDEYFTTSESVTFIDQILNTLPFEKIHLKPTVVNANNEEVVIENFTMTEITNVNEKSYNITFDVPVKDGENVFNMTVSDITGQDDSVSFIIEKNTKLVEFKIQESEMTDSEIFKNDNESYSLVNNKNSCFVKILVFNETRKERNSEKFLIVSSGNKTEKHRIQTKNDTRFVAFYLPNTLNGNTYSLSYNEFSDELLKIDTKKQDELYLKIEETFVIGSNYYHLNYFKDEFSTVSVEYTNRQNFKCELHDKYIEITRIKNSNFIEDIILTITVNDKNGNYSHVSKTVNGKFYNETVISDYYVDGAENVNGKLDEPMFDLVVKSQEHQNVQHMTVYDESELNVYKRKKIAYYNNELEGYKFERITSPITPSSIKVNVQLKGDDALVLEKELFVNEKLYYSKNKNKVLTSVNKNTENVFVEMFSSEFDEVFKKIEFYINDSVFLEKEEVNIKVETPLVEKLNIIDLPTTAVLYCKFINKKNMVTYSSLFNLDFTIKRSLNNVVHNFDNKLLSIEKASKLYVDNFQTNTIELVATDSIGLKKTITLNKGDQIVDLFKTGEIYKVKLVSKDKNSSRVFYQNTIQVYDKLSDLIELKDNLFEKIKYNKTVSVKNESLMESSDLNCFLSHYVNGSLIKSYPPSINGRFIKFKIIKQKGLNKLVFNYNEERVELSSFNFTVDEVKEHSIHDIEVTDNILYAKDENEYILNGAADISLKTTGIKYLKIDSKSVGRVMEKTVADNFTCRIRKVWLPCEITAYDNEKKILNIPTVKFKILTSNKFTYKFKPGKQKNGTSILFKLGSSKPKIKNNSFKMKLNFYIFHRLYSFSNAFAAFIGNKEWLELEKMERNNIIKQITSGSLDEVENKKIIKKYLGGN